MAKTELKQETKQETSKSETVQLVYCGANWLKHGLTKYQVFLGGMSYNLKEAIKELPEIEKLICNVSELDELRAKISTKGTYESQIYEKLEDYIRKGNK